MKTPVKRNHCRIRRAAWLMFLVPACGSGAGKGDTGGGSRTGSAGAPDSGGQAGAQGTTASGSAEETPSPPITPGTPVGIRNTICGDQAWIFDAAKVGKPELVADTGTIKGTPLAFSFLEGPVWLIREGVLLFTDFNVTSALNTDKLGPPSIIWRLETSGVVTAALPEGTVRSNGMAVDADGNVFVADHGIRGISKIASDGKRSVVADTFDGKPFNAPNDLVLSANGTIYFTDPTYGGQVDGREQFLGQEGVYRITPDHKVHLIDKALKRPNGITISLDERWLYVSSKDESMIYRYAMDENGQTGEKQAFITGQPVDGVSLDCAGNLYLAVPGKALRVFDANGQFVWETLLRKNVSNLAFGGPRNDILYVTEHTKLHRIQMAVPGLPY